MLIKYEYNFLLCQKSRIILIIYTYIHYYARNYLQLSIYLTYFIR